MTDPVDIAELVGWLRKAAHSVSEIQRSMAQAKSLRQAGHNPPRDDLYMWPAPEQTREWKAADLIEQQAARLEAIAAEREAMRSLILKWERGNNHDEGAFDADCETCLILADFRAALSPQKEHE